LTDSYYPFFFLADGARFLQHTPPQSAEVGDTYCIDVERFLMFKILTYNWFNFRLFYFSSLMQLLSQKMVESVVVERFGPETLRIFRFILMKKHLEEKQVKRD
jgi:hypothetical protein